jgi:hypothetical protein
MGRLLSYSHILDKLRHVTNTLAYFAGAAFKKLKYWNVIHNDKHSSLICMNIRHITNENVLYLDVTNTLAYYTVFSMMK